MNSAADVVGDDPEGAVLGREVDGEEAAIAAAGGLVVGGLVVLAEVAPIAGGMAIEQGGDLVVGHGGGHHTAEAVAHGWKYDSLFYCRLKLTSSAILGRIF